MPASASIWRSRNRRCGPAKSTRRVGRRAANPGSNIEAYFKPYHNWVEGEPGRAADRQLLHNLNEIRESLLVTANYPSQAGPANEKLRLQVVNLRGTVSRLPKPFARMVSEIVDEFEGAEAGSTKAQMNQALANRRPRFCQRVTVGKYPFSRDSSEERADRRVRAVVRPERVMDKFFADYLAPIVDMSGSKSGTGRRTTRLGAGTVASTRCRQFQRAADIRNAFFPDGGPTPNIQLTIAPHTISKDADMALLEVNQIVLQTSLAGNAPARPSPGRAMAAPARPTSASIPELPGRESRIGREGRGR